MKKAIYSLSIASFVLSEFFIWAPTVLGFFGISVEITSVAAIGTIAAVLVACALILEIFFKPEIKGNAFAVMMAAFAPLSLAAIPSYSSECKSPLALLGFLIQTVCFALLAVRCGKNVATKITGAIVSFVLLMPVLALSFFGYLFGNFGKVEAVYSTQSPSGAYYAEVIDDDQGALGGNTYVDVYKKGGADLLLCKIKRKPQRVYSGDWGEFEDMQIYWKDDNCLVINSVEYEIE